MPNTRRSRSTITRTTERDSLTASETVTIWWTPHGRGGILLGGSPRLKGCDEEFQSNCRYASAEALVEMVALAGWRSGGAGGRGVLHRDQQRVFQGGGATQGRCRAAGRRVGERRVDQPVFERGAAGSE